MTDPSGAGLPRRLGCCALGLLWLACSSNSVQSAPSTEPSATLAAAAPPPAPAKTEMGGEGGNPMPTSASPGSLPPQAGGAPVQSAIPPNTAGGGAGPDAGGQGGSPSTTAPSALPSSSAPSPVGAPTGGTAGAAPAEPMLGADGFPLECVQQIPLAASSDTRFPVSVKLEQENTPLVFGEENALGGGGTVIPTNLRFYLSQFTLLRGEERVPVFPTGQDGGVVPYGVHLANAEEEASLSFELTAPAGPYEGISFLVGLSPACNGDPRPLNAPLDEAAQLKWPHLQGFLFLRFEGLLSDDAMPDVPSVHMGAALGENGGAPRVTVEMPIEGAIELTVDFGAFLQAAAAETDLSDTQLFPGDEIIAGERGRRALRDQSAVVFLPSNSP